jgi:hypothetical protein
LDGNFLIVKDGWLNKENSFGLVSHKYNPEEIGKWQLMLESTPESRDKIQTE